MLTIKNNNFDKWDLLQKVLSGDIPENDLQVQSWLCEDPLNRELYNALKEGNPGEGIVPDKDKMFGHIADTLSFNTKRLPFHKRPWFSYAAAVFMLLASGLTIFFILQQNETSKMTATTSDNPALFDPGTKKAYLLSSEGVTIDLSESFQLKKEDGTVISNDADGIVCVEKTTEEMAASSKTIKKKNNKKKQIDTHTIHVPKGGEYMLVLADGSKVYLNSETSLTFPTFFEGDERIVELTGEAYFKVEKGEKPFIVHTPEMQIRVFGTSFNVNAYADNPYAVATLVEGSVEVNTPNTPTPIPLKPGENLNINKVTHQISVSEVDTDMYTAWVNGEFIFRNHSLQDILTQLARWYDFTIEYKNPSIQHMKFTGSAEKNRSLDYLLNMISAVTDVKYKTNNDTIILYK